MPKKLIYIYYHIINITYYYIIIYQTTRIYYMQKNEKKRIAIIGGGTGLIQAWLLVDHFNVTLYEKTNRLGGHIQSLKLKQSDNKEAIIEAGTEFINPDEYVNFYKLLNFLGMKLKSYTMKMEFIDYTKKDSMSNYEKTFFSPGVTDLLKNYSDEEKKCFSEGCCSCMSEFDEDSKKFGNLFLMQYLIHKFNKSKESLKNITTKEFIDSLFLTKFNKNFGPEFFYPFTNASWGIDPSNAEGTEPRNAEDYMAFYTLYYIAAGNTYQEVEGGLSKYIDALYELVKNKCKIKLNSEVTQIENGPNNQYKISYIDNDKNITTIFDEVIVCTSFEIANKITKSLSNIDNLRTKISAVTYYTTKICIHESFDKDFDKNMVVHIKHTGKRSSLHITKPWNNNLTRSWVFKDEQDPQNTLATIYYRHPNMTKTYYNAQEALKDHNTKQTGLYFGSIIAGFNDSHESAITAALSITNILSKKYNIIIPQLELFTIQNNTSCCTECNCTIQ
jgi:predicted NAD/FAD-binding protein